MLNAVRRAPSRVLRHEVVRKAGLIARDRTVERRGAETLRLRHHRGERLDVVVFFCAQPWQLYQLRQWIGPLEALSASMRVAVLCSEAVNAATIAQETRLPVRMSRNREDRATWIEASGARLVLYVNQNTLNFQTLALPAPAHAHLSHGESEKVSMVSNQLKAYDRVFTAGPAARERIRGALVGMGEERFVDVGRPQLDVDPGPRRLSPTTRTTLLYAPTWEGGDAAMAYSTVATHGPALVRAVLTSTSHRLVYRPHPQTGVRSPAVRAADALIRELVAAADPTVGHVVDDGPDYGWQLGEADACVCDISAVSFDWLATGKPLLLAAGAGQAAAVGPTTARMPRIASEDAPDVLARLAEVDTGAARAERAELTAHHFGDTSPGASLERFVRACVDTHRERCAALGESVPDVLSARTAP